MAIAAGKSAGKPPRMTDNAFKPPTEAAMAIDGEGTAHGRAEASGGATLAGFFCPCAGGDFFFISLSAMPAEAGIRRHILKAS